MIHTIITLVIAVCFYFFGLHKEAACLTTFFYIGREYCQAEYRAIEHFYGGKRANAPWYCGFDLRVWNIKSLLDWIGPLSIASALV